MMRSEKMEKQRNIVRGDGGFSDVHGFIFIHVLKNYF